MCHSNTYNELNQIASYCRAQSCSCLLILNSLRATFLLIPFCIHKIQRVVSGVTLSPTAGEFLYPLFHQREVITVGYGNDCLRISVPVLCFKVCLSLGFIGNH